MKRLVTVRLGQVPPERLAALLTAALAAAWSGAGSGAAIGIAAVSLFESALAPVGAHYRPMATWRLRPARFPV